MGVAIHSHISMEKTTTNNNTSMKNKKNSKNKSKGTRSRSSKSGKSSSSSDIHLSGQYSTMFVRYREIIGKNISPYLIHSLTSVDLSDCDLVTDVGIRPLALCAGLTTLRLRNCHRVSVRILGCTMMSTFVC